MEEWKIATDTSKAAPIETAPGMDADGMTTAERGHGCWELNTAVYARWFRSNILENEFAEEGTEHLPCNTNAECGGQASKDTGLTARVAKKCPGTQKNEPGEQAEGYFTKVEDKARERALRLPITGDVSGTPPVHQQGNGTEAVNGKHHYRR